MRKNKILPILIGVAIFLSGSAFAFEVWKLLIGEGYHKIETLVNRTSYNFLKLDYWGIQQEDINVSGFLYSSIGRMYYNEEDIEYKISTGLYDSFVIFPVKISIKDSSPIRSLSGNLKVILEVLPENETLNAKIKIGVLKQEGTYTMQEIFGEDANVIIEGEEYKIVDYITCISNEEKCEIEVGNIPINLESKEDYENLALFVYIENTDQGVENNTLSVRTEFWIENATAEK